MDYPKFNIPEAFWKINKSSYHSFDEKRFRKFINNSNDMLSSIYKSGSKAISDYHNNINPTIIDYPKDVFALYERLGFCDFCENELNKITALFFKNSTIVKEYKFKNKVIAYLKQKANDNKEKQNDSLEKKAITFDSGRKIIILKQTEKPCHGKHSDIEDVKFFIPSFNGKTIIIFGYYCKECNNMYISRVEYENHCRNIKFLPYVFYDDNNDYVFNEDDLRQESPLFRNGYKVNNSANLTEQERRIILDGVILMGLMTKENVINTIESNIFRSSYNPNNRMAIVKWKSDLDYLKENEYIVREEDNIYKKIKVELRKNN